MVARRGKSYGGPWYSNYHTLVIFEQRAKEQFPSINATNKRSGRKIWREYTLTMDVPEFGCSREVVIKMQPECTGLPNVTVDGPTISPHRYHEDDGELCMWYPYDPKECKWMFADGLLHLLVLIQAHLFREAWWRETGGEQNGEWLGPEVPHRVERLTKYS